MKRFQGPLSGVFLVVFGTLVGMAALEAAARLMAVREERGEGRLDRDLEAMAGPRPRSVATLGQIIRKSDNPRVVYELRPRLDVLFANARLTTSDAGHRGPDVIKPKPASAFRIVGIGDSYMFGQGVSDEDTYLAHLPKLMHGLPGGRALETVNLAVPGFNTVMEVELLRERGPGLEPDLVLVEIVGNDLDLPNFLWSAVDPWTPRRSFLLDFIRGRLAAGPRHNEGARGLSQAPQEEGRDAQTYARSADRVPAQYRPLVGLSSFRDALKGLAEFGRKRNIPVLAMTHGVWFEQDMLEALKDNEIPVLVLRSALRQRARQLGAPDYARSPLALSATDLHPSQTGHRAIAEELATWLKSQLPVS